MWSQVLEGVAIGILIYVVIWAVSPLRSTIIGGLNWVGAHLGDEAAKFF
jgi:hypothetical protein